MKNLLIVLGIIFLLILIEIIREITTFKVTHYEIVSGKLKKNMGEKKIAFISDLHNYSYGKDNGKLLKAIEREEPDIILSAGDLLVGDKNKSSETAEKFVASLTSEFPVYCANGNHEQRMKEKPENYDASYEEYKKQLQLAGVHFLENETVHLDKLNLTGLEIPLTGYQRMKKGNVEFQEIVQRIGEKEGEEFQILLAHNPCYMDLYKAWGADLILSGHLHGGVARIPGVLGVITPGFQLFPKYSGDIYREGEQTIVVCKGLGTHTVNIRFLNPAELVVLHLQGKPCAKEENPV